jgi:dienelactone hydrolase
MKIEDNYIKINNQTIFTRQYTPVENSKKPTIVLLHEALGYVAHWRDLPEKLAAKTNSVVFLYDRLGHIYF